MTDLQYDELNGLNPLQYDNLDPVAAVVAAWTTTWSDQAWQQDCYRWVRDVMPALAEALDRLAIQELREEPEPVIVSPSEPEQLEPESQPESEPEAEPEPEAAEIMCYRDHLILCEYDSASVDDEWLDQEMNPEFPKMTVEDLGARARRATERMRVWGRRAAYKASMEREHELRDKIIVYLNDMDNVTQRKIAEMVGLSVNRITMLIGYYYDRLDREHEAEMQRIRRELGDQSPSRGGLTRT